MQQFFAGILQQSCSKQRCSKAATMQSRSSGKKQRRGSGKKQAARSEAASIHVRRVERPSDRSSRRPSDTALSLGSGPPRSGVAGRQVGGIWQRRGGIFGGKSQRRAVTSPRRDGTPAVGPPISRKIPAVHYAGCIGVGYGRIRRQETSDGRQET